VSEPSVILEMGRLITPNDAEAIRSAYLRQDTHPLEWKTLKRKFRVEVVRLTRTAAALSEDEWALIHKAKGTKP
jgi:hypothetical protein